MKNKEIRDKPKQCQKKPFIQPAIATMYRNKTKSPDKSPQNVLSMFY